MIQALIVITIGYISLRLVQQYDNSNGVVGDLRIIKRFIIVPTEIEGDKRFLVNATVEQVYYKTHWGDCKWTNKRWIDADLIIATTEGD